MNEVENIDGNNCPASHALVKYFKYTKDAFCPRINEHENDKNVCLASLEIVPFKARVSKKKKKKNSSSKSNCFLENLRLRKFNFGFSLLAEGKSDYVF